MADSRSESTRSWRKHSMASLRDVTPRLAVDIELACVLTDTRLGAGAGYGAPGPRVIRGALSGGDAWTAMKMLPPTGAPGSFVLIVSLVVFCLTTVPRSL